MHRTQRIEGLFGQDQEFFSHLTLSHERTVNWMRDEGLLPSERFCCNQACRLGANNRSIDGQMFHCRVCRTKYSVREGTRWERFRRVPLIVLIRTIFHYFPNQYSARKAFEALERSHVNISYATVKRIYQTVRTSIAEYMTGVIYNTPLRGRIQVDEALFTHRAGPGRRGRRQVWVVGFLEERSGEAYVFVVRNRNATTINQLIVHNIMAGSFIIHDGWGGYNRIPNVYRHHRYLHGNDPNNTSRIEGV